MGTSTKLKLLCLFRTAGFLVSMRAVVIVIVVCYIVPSPPIPLVSAGEYFNSSMKLKVSAVWQRVVCL